jgi:hypothetical protein
MREILFRGKRVDTGEWVFGYYTKHTSGKIFIRCISKDCTQSYEVIPSSVGQYTGLKINGQKVFEGEIIKFLDGSCFIVEQKYNLCSVKYRNLNNYPSLFNDKIDVIVIGNIHDNPELVGKSEQLEERLCSL